jgi:hypothetical protein
MFIFVQHISRIAMTKWQTIINKIEELMHVQHKEQWATNEYALLKALNINISQKLKELVCANYKLAEHLKDQNWRTYKNLPTEKVESLIQNDIEENGAGSKYVFDLRILIDYFLKGKQPAQGRTKNAFCLYAFGVLYDFYGMDSTLLNHNQDQNKIRQYYGSTWWVYWYEENVHALARGVLKIQTSNDISLAYPAHHSPTYEGKMSLHKNLQHLHFEFTSASVGEKHLNIVVSVGIGNSYPLAMGVYTNILKDGSTIAGKVILARIFDADNSEDIKPELVKPDQFETRGVPTAIAQYFIEKAPHVLRVTHSVHSIDELGAWLNDQRKTPQNSTKNE